MKKDKKIPSIRFLMRIKNVTLKSQKIFEKTILHASRLSKNFLIVNNASTDKTEEVVFKLKKKLNLNLQYHVDNTPYYETIPYNYSQDIKEDYIFFLEDDEVITDDLLKEFRGALQKDYTLFCFRSFTILNNEIIDYNSKVYRLFKSSYNNHILKPSEDLHLYYNIKGIKQIPRNEIYNTKNGFLHYSAPNIDFYSKKILYFTKLEAIELYKKNSAISSKKLLLFLLKKMGINAIYHLFVIRRLYFSLNALLLFFLGLIYPVYIVLYYLELKNKNKDL